jgi:sugar lactone lactonase YvrE
LEKKEVTTLITIGQMSITRPRVLGWSPDGNTMYVTNDQGSEDGISNVALKRDEEFLKAEVVTRSRSCNGMAVHPVNGELYFSQWEGGSIWRDDLSDDEPKKELFKIWANGYEIGIIFHPTGNYAYMIGHNFHSIVKSTYNWAKKELEVPQLFVGTYGSSGWKDDVGTSARLTNPWQGVFVKNEEYVKQGKEDQYDFYIADRNTHSIRKITPEGMVVTIAGRGSEGLNGNAWGYVDGDLRKEARFNQPYGIVYDEETTTFYVADTENRRIRKITIEGETVSESE